MWEVKKAFIQNPRTYKGVINSQQQRYSSTAMTDHTFRVIKLNRENAELNKRDNAPLTCKRANIERTAQRVWIHVTSYITTTMHCVRQ